MAVLHGVLDKTVKNDVPSLFFGVPIFGSCLDDRATRHSRQNRKNRCAFVDFHVFIWKLGTFSALWLPNMSSKLSSRPAFQSSIKSVKWLVIDAQGVVETSQSTCIAQFFPLYSNFVVPRPSLAFLDELTLGSKSRFC